MGSWSTRPSRWATSLGRPTNPDFLLRRNELLELAVAHDLVVVAFEDVEIDEPKPAVVQRIAARRPA